MTTTTGTTIEQYAAWLKREVDNTRFGEVGIYLTIHGGQIVNARKTTVDSEQFKVEGYVPPPPRVGKKGET